MHPGSNKNQELITNLKKRTKLITEHNDSPRDNSDNKKNNKDLNIDLTSRPLNIQIEEDSLIKTNTLNNNLEKIMNKNQNNQNLENSINNIKYGVSYTENIKEIYDKSPHLEIEILNSFILPKGKIIKINPLGLSENSLRKKKDGFTYFGYEENDDNEIDFLIKPKDENIENRFIGKHFQIRFNPDDMKYYIIDCGFGFGTFMKIINDIQIQDNYLINIGNSYIVCTFDFDENNFCNEKILNLKVFTGDYKSSPLIFNSDEQKFIFIGRDNNCDVVIEDSLLSRFHCTIFYQNNVGWILKDGKVNSHFIQEKNSTNGTWLFLINETLIFDNMIFKANHSLFKCNYTNINC